MINTITEEVIGAAIDVHKVLGPGLLESAYEKCLCHELSSRNISFQRQKELPVRCKGIKLDCGSRLDLLVQDLVVVEIQAIEKTLPIHGAQRLTYLKLGNWQAGLLLNFNVPILKNGIRRKVLGLRE